MGDKKGFTLIELLAIIVILAVVMLIGATAVGPIMTKSRKGALGTEGLGAVDGAKTAYQVEQMNGSFTSTSSVCFDLRYLNSKGYFEKGTGSDNYTGSVLVTYEPSTSSYTYTFWISNGTYVFTNVNVTSYKPDSATDGTSASANCGGATGVVRCSAAGTCA